VDLGQKRAKAWARAISSSPTGASSSRSRSRQYNVPSTFSTIWKTSVASDTDVSSPDSLTIPTSRLRAWRGNRCTRPLKADEAADPKGFGYGSPFEVECLVGGVRRLLVVSRTRPKQEPASTPPQLPHTTSNDGASEKTSENSTLRFTRLEGYGAANPR
jgi:hypothetical protein